MCCSGDDEINLGVLRLDLQDDSPVGPDLHSAVLQFWQKDYSNTLNCSHVGENPPVPAAPATTRPTAPVFVYPLPPPPRLSF